MGRWFSDEAIVAIKSGAYEGVATYLRRKLLVSDREVGGEGRNMLKRWILII